MSADQVSLRQTAQAIVSRAAERPGGLQRYLVLEESGSANWTADATSATVFGTLREAVRASLRLPANVRAFGLPLGC